LLARKEGPRSSQSPTKHDAIKNSFGFIYPELFSPKKPPGF
jgi:hypothetical protein